MCKNLLDPKTDYIFKQIFGQEDYVDTLISFLNALFKGKPYIKSLQLENTEITKLLQDNKTSRLDVRARTDQDIELDIEIQCANTGEIPERALHCTANLFPQNLREGESYRKSRVIAIWILAENVTSRIDAISDAYMTFQPSKSDGYSILSENERIIFIELKKFNPQNVDRRDLLNTWLAFLQAPDLMDSSWLETPEVTKAMDRLKYISADDEIRAIADLRRKDLNNRISEKAIVEELKKEKEDLKKEAESLKKEAGTLKEQAESLKEQAENLKEEAENLKEEAEELKKQKKLALEQAEEEKRKSVKTALVMGLEINQVAKITGLSIEEIEKIKNI